ncbi:MAG: TonB-dependent receptor [Proteobacteria bacterium]|nr:TonB-dependent receptor [Pseudomonadota bacterium]
MTCWRAICATIALNIAMGQALANPQQPDDGSKETAKQAPRAQSEGRTDPANRAKAESNALSERTATGRGVHFTVGEVIVIDDKKHGPLGAMDVLTSVDMIGADQLHNETVNEPLEMLKRVPALYVETFNQGIISADIGIRGFNTQGDVAHTKLLIDGIPSNLHIGYPDLKSIFPVQVERIEVVKGTNDARYGLNNVAGNVNVVTRSGGNKSTGRILFGSFATIEPQMSVAIERGGLSQNYSAAYRHSGGYRDNATVDRAAGSAKWSYRPVDGISVAAILRGSYMDADAPGYLNENTARDNPKDIVDFASFDGGKQRNGHGSLHLDYQIASTLSLGLKSYAQTFRRSRWVRFDQEFDQQERLEHENQYGAISVLTYRPTGLPVEALDFEWGVDYQMQENLHQRHASDQRVRTGDILRDHEFTFHTMGSYLQARIRPISPLQVVAGLRVDRVAGSFTNRMTDTAFDINDYGTIWQPKVSALITPIANHSIYANYGRTFQVGVGIGAYEMQSTALEPSINDGIELGYRTTPVPWLNARIAYWQQRASNEVRLKFDDSGESENIGETMRRGFDIELGARPLENLYVWVAYSRHGSEQIEPGARAPERKGKELDHVPAFTAKGGVEYRVIPQLLLSLWAYTQGDYYLTKENNIGKYGDYTLVNVDASYDILPWLELGGHIKNALGASHDTAVWYKDYGILGTQHNPGDGRAFYTTITASL